MVNPIVGLAHKALENGMCYDLFQSAVGATKTRRFLIDAISVWENPKHVIDLGCGTGFSIPRLIYTDTYFGVDFSAKYLNIAKRIPTRMETSFLQADLGDSLWSLGLSFTKPQVVMAMGLFHHLSDSQMGNLFATLGEFLPNGSSIVSIDPVITGSTSRVGRWVASNDRGKFIRSPEELDEIAKRVGFTSELRVFQNQIRIPADTMVGVISV
jgi:cyclopropane fatty-acyl-phospholipid synthase-like methyltransferase